MLGLVGDGYVEGKLNGFSKGGLKYEENRLIPICLPKRESIYVCGI